MKEMDDIYLKMAPEDIPWNMEEPPEVLVSLVESGKVKPCKAIDLGCGAGNYAIYLASRDFEVTGVDISSAAIKLAGENARSKGADCRFMAADLTGDLNIGEEFDFSYDWEVLHHVFPENREKYVDNVWKLLKPFGNYLSVSFCEDSPQFGGTGKYRETPIGTVLYFSSERELEELFAPRFKIIELKTIEVRGKFAPHLAVKAFLEKK
jgi:SAM-dependent methyltransferase